MEKLYQPLLDSLSLKILVSSDSSSIPMFQTDMGAREVMRENKIKHSRIDT